MLLAFVVQVQDHLSSDLLVRFNDFQNLSIAHLDDSIGEVFESLIVSNHNHGDLVLDVQVNQNLHDNICGFGIEITGWLIEEENRRVVTDRPSDCHTLLLTTGEHVWEMVKTFAEAYVLEELRCSLPDFFSVQLTSKLHWELNVLKSSQRPNQVESLENETQFVKSDRSQELVLCTVLDSKSTDINIPF